MPTIETVTIKSEKFGRSEHQYFNIAFPVGTGMANHFGDVMVIQALLNYVGSNKTTAGGLGFGAEDMPVVTGVFDTRTEHAIAAFQSFNSSLLLNTDGKIHPGSFRNRTLKNSPPHMMISMLNEHAEFATVLNGGNTSDHIQKILQRYPHLRAAVAADLPMV